MRFETAILRKTHLRRYRLCLAMLEAYTELAPWWERLALLGYCGLGSWVAGHLGVDTPGMWRKGERIMQDILAASGRSMPEIAALLRQLVQMRLNGSQALPFDEAKAEIYDQFYYPVGAHITFALQPSAIARLGFALQAVAAEGLDHPDPSQVLLQRCREARLLGLVVFVGPGDPCEDEDRDGEHRRARASAGRSPGPSARPPRGPARRPWRSGSSSSWQRSSRPRRRSCSTRRWSCGCRPGPAHCCAPRCG